MNIKISVICLIICFIPILTHSQIGYQVSLLNTITGEPRINEAVSVTIDITDSEGNTLISEKQTTSTNEFGILSLQIGKADSFASMDWSKLPLWVSATVDGTVIGKSQILNIPVAEYAKTSGILTERILMSKKRSRDGDGVPPVITFLKDGRGYLDYYDGSNSYFTYVIDGNSVLMELDRNDDTNIGGMFHYNPKTGKFHGFIRDHFGVWE